LTRTLENQQKGDVFLEWLQFMTDKAIVPQTINISYSILEKYVPLEYGTAICKLFAELGLRGASVIIASGNRGVGPPGAEGLLGWFRKIPVPHRVSSNLYV